MTLAGRLEKIETRLTPKQAVLLWLKEQQENFEDFADYQTGSRSAALVRIADNVAKAVRESLKYKRKKEEIARIELGARRQTSFLFTLPVVLNAQVSTNASKDWLLLQLLQEQRLRMAKPYKEDGVFDREEWNHWRKTLLAVLRRMWRLKATIEAVNLRYFNGCQILFDRQKTDLDENIASAECLAQVYSMTKPQGGTLPAISLAAQRRSAEHQVPDAVSELLSEVRSMCS
jgi:hypothetical protein